MDRDALVRGVRRRQAHDALAFERERAALLAEQLEETVASVEGARVDTTLYAQLTTEDVALVRTALRDVLNEGDEDESSADDADDLDVEAADDADDDLDEDDPQDEDEAEIARLQDELAQSAQLQAALERYLDIVGGPS